MTRITVSSYSFSRLANTVTLSGITTVVKGEIVSIVNASQGNKVLYLSSDASSASLNGKVLTLPTGAMYDVSPHDELVIIYDTNLDEIPGAPGDLTIASISGLQAALDGKAPTVHSHVTYPGSSS